MRAAPLLAALLLVSGTALAHGEHGHGQGHAQQTPAAAPTEFTAGEIKAESPWARATTSQAKAGAVYLTLHNDGTAADRLTGGDTPVAERVELHSHIMDGGIARMRQVEGGIPLPPVESVTLAPGGLHVMLIGLKAPLAAGESFPLTLTFEKAGPMSLTVAVRKPGDAAPGHDHHGHHEGHHGEGHGHHGHHGDAKPQPAKPTGHNH